MVVRWVIRTLTIAVATSVPILLKNRPTPSDLKGRDMVLKQRNVLEVMKSAGNLHKGEGPILQI